MGVGSVHSTFLSLLPVSMWFMCILSYRTSVQLDIRKFRMMVVLSLVVILKWLWEVVSIAFTYDAILIRNPMVCIFILKSKHIIKTY